ncbi:MAG TPA: hypothetical protein VGE00_05370 [Gammaproteobacteria bacterium]
MNIEIDYQGKPLTIHLTRGAEAALRQRTTPLVAEMELYFSCMIRKRVRFHTVVRHDRTVLVADNLCVGFRPVMTEQCRIDGARDDEVALTDFPIARRVAYLPSWLRIDFRQGEWLGEFGYL